MKKVIRKSVFILLLLVLISLSAVILFACSALAPYYKSGGNVNLGRRQGRISNARVHQLIDNWYENYIYSDNFTVYRSFHKPSNLRVTYNRYGYSRQEIMQMISSVVDISSVVGQNAVRYSSWPNSNNSARQYFYNGITYLHYFYNGQSDEKIKTLINEPYWRNLTTTVTISMMHAVNYLAMGYAWGVIPCNIQGFRYANGYRIIVEIRHDFLEINSTIAFDLNGRLLGVTRVYPRSEINYGSIGEGAWLKGRATLTSTLTVVWEKPENIFPDNFDNFYFDSDIVADIYSWGMVRYDFCMCLYYYGVHSAETCDCRWPLRREVHKNVDFENYNTLIKGARVRIFSDFVVPQEIRLHYSWNFVKFEFSEEYGYIDIWSIGNSSFGGSSIDFIPRYEGEFTLTIRSLLNLDIYKTVAFNVVSPIGHVPD